MKTILVATDFSERSDRALRRAKLLARRTGARLSLLHVVDDDQPQSIVDVERDEATRLLDRTAQTLRDIDGLACDTRVAASVPFAGIARVVREVAADLLVIGPHRRQVLKDVFVGTTAERTIRSVECPVLMANAPPVGPYRHVMQTTDMSDLSADALRRLAALDLAEDGASTLLHVFDAPALKLVMASALPEQSRDHQLDLERDKANRALAGFVEQAGLDGVLPLVRYGPFAAAQEILGAARADRADLIVLATHGRTGLKRLLLGSVTERVLRGAAVDVLAIPPKAVA
ncbi:hypothetical protein OCGS_2811 [Oceaniovalibus guishaninsula JLT2003]|uniref:UspA domain-containing protein n=1 Tax=Oceaniovalibus guishaninsula JLT2003 TaxID=1231392 RepID=K2I2Y1_9RHOB|nr:universal stress protein [Oceaniovalibus guishaninsula]EKE43220.1 hypothetical protein OCGS_2811 [Oceaniovalibus guishaninsula JLT2003]